MCIERAQHPLEGMGIRIRVACLCLGLASFGARQLQAEELSAAELVEIVRVQLEEVKTIQAVVSVTTVPGVSREEHYQAWLEYQDLMEEHYPEYYDPEDRSRSYTNGGLSAGGGTTMHYRYVSSGPGLLRVERLDDEFSTYGNVTFFSGELWKDYQSQNADAESPVVHIGEDHWDEYQLEIAQGTSIVSPITHTRINPAGAAPGVDVGFDLPPDAPVRKSIGWSELLEIVEMETAVVAETPRPYTGEMLPSLRVRSPKGTIPVSDGVSLEVAFFEITLWFDPQYDYRISAAQFARFQPNGDFSDGELGEAEILYPPLIQLTWSNLIEADGQSYYQNCRAGHFGSVNFYESNTICQHLLAAEIQAIEYTFASWSASSDPSDPAKFEPPMEPGTLVFDVTRGLRYEIGDQGQEINARRISP